MRLRRNGYIVLAAKLALLGRQLAPTQLAPMMKANPASVALTLLVLTVTVPSMVSGQRRDGTFTIRNFRFHTGATLPELRLHYTTLGAPRGVPVLVLHGTGGSAENVLGTNPFTELFAHGQPLDTSRYLVVLPDAIGHGQSSKPSDGLRARFPQYNYADMIDAEYRLLTEHLGIKHLRLVLGFSMGGMKTWLWGERHPSFMDILVPLAALPTAMGGRNWILRQLLVDAIRTDPGWRAGDYVEQPTAWRRALVWYGVATDIGARDFYRMFPNSVTADSALDRWLDAISRPDAPDVPDANDALYQTQASRDYDPTPGWETISATVLAINSVDDLVNPPELGVMEAAIGRLKHGRYVLLPLTDASRGHGTVFNVTLWKNYLADVLGSTPAAGLPPAA